MIGMLLTAAALAATPVEGAFDWTPPESWKLPVWRDGDFHYLMRDGGQRGPLGEHPAFKDFIIIYRPTPTRHPDGSIEFVLDDYEKALTKDGNGVPRPFMFTFAARTTLRPYILHWADIRFDKAKYDAWLAAHPTYLGTFTGEWVNDATMPFHSSMAASGKTRGHHKDWKLTPEQREAVMARDQYVHCKDNRYQFTTNLLKKCYRRLEEVYLHDGSRFMIGDGCLLADHLNADWGSGILGIETTRNGNLWQKQVMSVRGAAREFGGLPWRWYLASYFRGFNSKGKWDTSGYLSAAHPDQGISASALKRGNYLTYLSGASFWEREDMGGAFWDKEKEKISPDGENFLEFRKFVDRVPDRGVPYQPVAILMSRFRGYSRTGGKAWRQFPYIHSDRHLDVVFSTILEGVKNISRKELKKGRERVMANSRYGDLFDLLVADCERQECFRKALGDYSAAVLTGEYAAIPEMEQTLRDYVEKGGTLVLNIAQLNDNLAWAKGGEVIRKNAKNEPVYSEKALGKGRVILSHIPYDSPWYGDDDASVRRMLGETTDDGNAIAFPEVDWLFDRLLEPLMPAKVEGDIQYGFNRTKTGWLVYLVNNGGVTKFADRPAEYDPKGAEVKIDLSRLPHGSLRELVTNQAVEQTNNQTITLTVPSGDLRVLEVR